MKIRKLLLALIIFLNLSPIVLVPQVAHAVDTSAVCEGVGLAAGGSGCEPAGSTSVQSVLRTALNILSFIIGVAAIFMIMLGGFKYVTSGGDGAKTASAKDTIMYAIVGLVVVAFAQIIVKFVLTKIK